MEKMMQRTTARFSVSNYKELGHYSSKCPEGNNKANTQGSLKEDLNIITCYKYKKKEHYTRRCTKEGTPGFW
jgi:hypothetical protein